MEMRSQQWQQQILFLALAFSIAALGYSAPVMNTTPQEYSAVSGQNTYMECQVTGLQSGQTVSWKFIDHDVTISAGNNIQVTNPDKYEIDKPQTDQGGQSFWNLRIYDLKASDGGSYSCMVDGTNVKVTHTLKISDAPPSLPEKPLNVTDCCIAEGVEACALPVCDQSTPPLELLQILSTGADCVDRNLLNILKCGGDGRNHIGCCMRRGVSEHCQPLCYYEEQDEFLDRDYTQCIPESIIIAKCFTIGQTQLPSQPELVSAVSLPNGFLVTWSPPRENAHLVTGYKMQYRLKSNNDTDYTTTDQQRGRTKKKLNLKENAVYEVRVVAVTDYGASAPSYTVDVATSSSTIISHRNETVLACCKKQQLSARCQTFCRAETLQIGIHPDSVLPCYGELDRIFTCLVGGDITPCCKRTQVPETCLGLCSGHAAAVDYSEIQCMMFLPLMSACAIEGSGYLPLPPSNTRLVPGSITSNSAIVEWDPPSDNVTESYQVAWKPDKELGNTYSTATIVSGNRHQLTGLRETTLYRVLVVSVNQNGTSLPELTLLFITEGVTTIVPEHYNETACCFEKGVPDSCIQICNHTFRLEDAALTLGLSCSNYLVQMLVCGTDGRDHSYCCKESGVTEECQGLCKLRPTDQLEATPQLVNCVLQKNKLSKCFDEGKRVLPKWPTEIWVEKQDINSIVLNWKAPTGPNATSYVVEYSRDRQPWMRATTPYTFITLSKLIPGTAYDMRVYSVADNYTSLPSEIVTEYTLPVPTTNVTTDWTQVWQNRTHCCENSGLDDTCKKVCDGGNLLSQLCLNNTDKIIACGADGRDHRPCCTRYPDFPDACLPYCGGQAPTMDVAVAFCSAYIPTILTCFSDGQGLLPTPPQHFRVIQYTHENITVLWDRPASNCDTADCDYYVALWEDGKQDQMSRERTSSTSYTYTGLKSETKYRLVAVATSRQGSSLPSTSVLIVTRATPFEDIIVNQSPNNDVINSGGYVKFQCIASSSPVRVVKAQWIRNNKVASENNILVLNVVSKDDEGDYTCEVTYENGRNRTKTLRLNVKYKPFAVKIDEDSVLPGLNMDAYLQCQFRGFPEVVYWTKDGKSLYGYGSSKYEVKPLRNYYDTGLTMSILQVRNVVEEDYGSYTCVGHNKFGNNSKGMTGQLQTVLPTASPRPTLPPNTHMNECCITEGVSQGCASQLCTFSVDLGTAASAPQCLQYLEQFIFCGADHRDHSKCCTEQGIQDICLPMCRGEVPDMSRIDKFAVCLGQIETILQCAENGHKFIPTPPQSVSAQMQFDQMNVKWTAPLKNADKVDYYEIYYQSNEVKPLMAQVSSSLTSTVIGGVKKGSTYQIWMTAKNNYGESATTDNTTLLVSRVTPRKPENLAADLVADVNIRVQWDPPLSNVLVTVYWVYFKTHFEKDYKHVVVTGTTTRLEQLKSNTIYEIYVVPQSQDGAGQASEQISKQTGKATWYPSPTSAPQKSSEKTVGLAVGLVLALVLLVAVAVLSLFFYRRMGSKTLNSSPNTVAFENPRYGEPNSEVKISGLPGSSQTDNQFGYSTLHEDTEPEPKYNEYDNDTSRSDNDSSRRDNGDSRHAYDNPLVQGTETEEPATLNVDQ